MVFFFNLLEGWAFVFEAGKARVMFVFFLVGGGGTKKHGRLACSLRRWLRKVSSTPPSFEFILFTHLRFLSPLSFGFSIDTHACFMPQNAVCSQDREYTIPSLPSELWGLRLTCVQTAQGDKRAGGSRLWRLSLMQV